MNVNFLRKFSLLVLLAVGWANFAWAQDAVFKLTETSGNETTFTKLNIVSGQDLSQVVTYYIEQHKTQCNGATITMLQDYTVVGASESGGLGVDGVNITLDLNGHKLTTDGYISVNPGANLTITDSSKGGVVQAAGNQSGAIVILSRSVLNVKGGIFKPTASTPVFSLTVNENATLNISGGKIDNTKGLINPSYATGAINITGGSFTTNDDATLTNHINAGYKIAQANPNGVYPYSVVRQNAVAVSFDENGNFLNGLANYLEIISVTTDKATIRLLQDITIPSGYSATFAAGNDITLDVNGHTFKGIIAAGSDNRAVKLTLTDESSEKTGLVDVTRSSVIGVYSNSELTTNVNIKGTGDMAIFMLYDKGTLNIASGKISNASYRLFSFEGTPAISISGGYFSGDTDLSKYIADNCIITANPGTTVDATEYPWCISPIEVTLTYGDNTTKQAPTIGGVLVIDLADDNTDHDAWVSAIDVPADYKNVDVTIKKNFADTWQAFSVPFDIHVSEDLLQNFEVAKIWDTELNWDNNSTCIEFVRLTAGQSIPAFTPCLVRAKTAGKQDFLMQDITLYKNATKTIDCSNVDEKFTFTGVMQNTPVTGKYVLNSAGNLVEATSASATLTPLKFYMEVESKTAGTAVQSRKYAVRVIGDETTGINDINAAGTDAATTSTAVYNLQGVKVGTTTTGLPAGIYIQNGRKVVVR